MEQTALDRFYEVIEKINPYRDRIGRFTTAGGRGGAPQRAAQKEPTSGSMGKPTAKPKTAAQRQKEVDALTPAQQRKYEKAPASMTHDQALAHATSGPKRAHVTDMKGVQVGKIVSGNVQQWQDSIGRTRNRKLDGMHRATEKELAEHKFPPAYKDVYISNTVGKLIGSAIAPNGKLQYKYTEDHTKAAAVNKFARNVALDRKLGKLDKSLARDLDKGNDTAIALAIIRKTGMRPGGGVTNSQHDSYGASTLQARHVKVVGNKVVFNYVPGKHHGQPIQMTLNDAKIAAAVKSKIAGKKGTDTLFDQRSVSPTALTSYLRAQAGSQFKVKDLRTTVANTIAARRIQSLPAPKTATELKAYKNQVADEVASVLGNTRAVALSSYINSAAFAAWERGVS